MQNFILPQNCDWIAQLRWKVFSWISVGVYNREIKVLRQNRVRFRRFPVGRMHGVLYNNAPARYSILRDVEAVSVIGQQRISYTSSKKSTRRT
jgi:hypothetical protein